MSSQLRNKKIKSCFKEGTLYDNIPSYENIIYNSESLKIIHLYSFIKKLY